MGKRIVWIALCVFVGLALSFAAPSSARTGQNAYSNTTGGQGNTNRDGGGVNANRDSNPNAGTASADGGGR